MRNRPTLTAEDAHKMMAACKAEAQKNKWNVSICIVDDAGIPLLRAARQCEPDHRRGLAGQGPGVGGAGQPSKVMEERVKERPGFIKFPAGLPIQGAVPVMYEGQCVGAIGVSGVQSTQDEQVASAGASALA